jgi:hypothetical protein
MDIVAIDYETHLISNEHPAPKPVCLSFKIGNRTELIVGFDAMREFMKAHLESSMIIAHNAKFELLVTYEWFPELRPLIWKALDENRIYCTYVYELILNNTRKKQIHNRSLAGLVQHYFDEDISEDKKNPDSWRTRYSELDGAPLIDYPKEAVEYAIQDSVWAYKIYQEQRLKPLHYNLAVKTDFALNLMAGKGMLVDKTRVKELEDELINYLKPRYQILEKLEMGSIHELTGKFKKNIKNLQAYIEDKIENPIKTAKGAISVTEETLNTYPEDEVLSNFLDIKKYEKVLSAFVPNLKAADPVIRTQYTPVVSSGRTSSSKSSIYPSVNIQQMPRKVEGVKWDVRNCFVPRPGYKIVSIDYAGLELASTASQLKSLYRQSAMADVLNRGTEPTDMHSMLAARVMSKDKGRHISYEEFVVNKKDPEYGPYRQLVKPINLGFPGGIGYETMRLLLLREGIQTKYEVLHTSPFEDQIHQLVKEGQIRGHYNLRCQRTDFQEYALVFDELVGLKKELLDLYPELKRFLKTGHKSFLTGETKRTKNDFGEWEDEDMYRYNTHQTLRDWCTYTALCNGFLMQTPSAVGAKGMMYEVIKRYNDNPDVNPLALTCICT